MCFCSLVFESLRLFFYFFFLFSFLGQINSRLCNVRSGLVINSVWYFGRATIINSVHRFSFYLLFIISFKENGLLEVLLC